MNRKCEKSRVYNGLKLEIQKYDTGLIQKSYSVPKLLYVNRRILTKGVRIMLCDLLVLSNFNYCDILYDSCVDVVDKRKNQSLQNSCLRFIHGLKRGVWISHMLAKTGWLCMTDRRRLHIAFFYHKIIKMKTPHTFYINVLIEPLCIILTFL